MNSVVMYVNCNVINVENPVHTTCVLCIRYTRDSERMTFYIIIYIITARKPLRDRFRGVALTAHTIDLM